MCTIFNTFSLYLFLFIIFKNHLQNPKQKSPYDHVSLSTLYSQCVPKKGEGERIWPYSLGCHHVPFLYRLGTFKSTIPIRMNIQTPCKHATHRKVAKKMALSDVNAASRNFYLPFLFNSGDMQKPLCYQVKTTTKKQFTSRSICSQQRIKERLI